MVCKCNKLCAKINFQYRKGNEIHRVWGVGAAVWHVQVVDNLFQVGRHSLQLSVDVFSQLVTRQNINHSVSCHGTNGLHIHNVAIWILHFTLPLVLVLQSACLNVTLSINISQQTAFQTSPNFLSMMPVARSSSCKEDLKETVQLCCHKVLLPACPC